MKEKIEKLNLAKETLKKEFIGLDEIIDKIILSVTPWYVTPEIIQRPVVISLWGMTGTGKTSVISRLVELLDLKKKTMFVDCGKENNEGAHSIGDKVSEFFRLEDTEANLDEITKDLVFIFDEFQYARTIDESGAEVNNSNLRPIWNLMDSGILNLDENNYDFSYFLNFTEDFLEYAKSHQYVPLVNGEVVDPNHVKEILEVLGFFYYDRGIPGLVDGEYDYRPEEERNKLTSENEENPYRPVKIIEQRILRIMIRRLKIFNPRKSVMDFMNEILGFKTVGEFSEYLKEQRALFTTPRYINCNKSLIFVLGNLDEAFPASKDLSPDIDADIFYEETSKVSISDIKNSLLNRFRAEQIARIGNNIIKYPSLKREHFEKIIDSEISRVCSKFYETTGIKVTITQDLQDLIYSEGVCPVQGVRPLFTTIGTIFTPVFSDIIQKGLTGEIEVGVKDPELGWARDSVTLYYGKETKDLELELGKLRAPKNRKRRYSSSVHEAGHAVVMSYLTGEIPSAIISVDSDRGGITITQNSEMLNEIDSKKDLENDVMISLGGYTAEEIIFKDPGRILLGSGSDLEKAWDRWSVGIYKLGYFDPLSYSNWDTENNGCGIPGGSSDKIIRADIASEYEKIRDKVKVIISENRLLIEKVALRLGETGKMLGPEFESMILENKKGTLTKKRLEIAKEENNWTWYEKVLREDIKKSEEEDSKELEAKSKKKK